MKRFPFGLAALALLSLSLTACQVTPYQAAQPATPTAPATAAQPATVQLDPKFQAALETLAASAGLVSTLQPGTPWGTIAGTIASGIGLVVATYASAKSGSNSQQLASHSQLIASNAQTIAAVAQQTPVPVGVPVPVTGHV